MQIISYPVHYQLVCANSDFSSFSRISCSINRRLYETKRACVSLELHKKEFINVGWYWDKLFVEDERRGVNLSFLHLYFVLYSFL